MPSETERVPCVHCGGNGLMLNPLTLNGDMVKCIGCGGDGWIIKIKGIEEFRQKITGLEEPLKEVSKSAKNLVDLLEKFGVHTYEWQRRFMTGVQRAEMQRRYELLGPYKVLVIAESYAAFDHARREISAHMNSIEPAQYLYLAEPFQLREYDGANRRTVIVLYGDWKKGKSRSAQDGFDFYIQVFKDRDGEVIELPGTYRSESDRLDAMQGRQDYSTEEDEVCCICHEDICGGYPPEAYERCQAPYQYVNELQGWAHDSCAKDYFTMPDKVSDLKPSRTEQLP